MIFQVFWSEDLGSKSGLDRMVNTPLFGGMELFVQDENVEAFVFVSTSGSLPEGLMRQVKLI